MAQTLFSPPRNVDILVRNRDAAHKLRSGSPKFRDILRERCRNRVKENRQKYVNILRNASTNDLQKVLTDTLRQELMVFSESTVCNSEKSGFEITNDTLIDQELAMFDEMTEEAIDAEVEQIMYNYDMLLADEEAVVASLLEDDFVDIVVECPVCEEGSIVLSFTHVLCTHCDVTIPAQTTSLQELKYKIKSVVETHSYSCLSKPVFRVSECALHMVCSHCSSDEKVF